MSPNDQERLMQMFIMSEVRRTYKETYGDGWEKVYKEDKENGCLIKVN